MVVRDDLEKSTKFIYLAQSLEGEPKEMISGFAITDDNYSIAVHILRDRYDDPCRQTHVLLQKFHTLPTPKHNPKDLRNFLTEYRKVKTQLSVVLDFQQSELVIKSTLVHKLTFQTFDKICDLYVTHNFTLKQMETGIQHIIDKLEQANLVLGENSNVKQVGVSFQQPNLQTKQLNQKTNQQCSYCSCGHFSHDCTKYKTVNARKDRVMSLKPCFNCLKPVHYSKTCRSTRTCRTCGLHHHSSVCIKAHSNSNSSEASNPSPSNSNSTVSQGKSNQSSTSTSSTNCDAPNEAEELPMPMASSPRPSTLPAAQVRQYSWHHYAKNAVSDIRREFVGANKRTNRVSPFLSQQAPLVSRVHLLKVVRRIGKNERSKGKHLTDFMFKSPHLSRGKDMTSLLLPGQKSEGRSTQYSVMSECSSSEMSLFDHEYQHTNDKCTLKRSKAKKKERKAEFKHPRSTNYDDIECDVIVTEVNGDVMRQDVNKPIARKRYAQKRSFVSKMGLIKSSLRVCSRTFTKAACILAIVIAILGGLCNIKLPERKSPLAPHLASPRTSLASFSDFLILRFSLIYENPQLLLSVLRKDYVLAFRKECF